MKLPIDVATRVSARLSRLIESMVNDPDREEPPTLDAVRSALERGGSAHSAQVAMHPQERDSTLAEVNSLIEEYGGEALAHYFIAAKASEGLSRIIETAAADRNLPRAPTLARVRQAMVEGLTARLAGVPEGLRQDIFLPFFTTKKKGTGVGLSLARQVVLAHRGAISIAASPTNTIL